MKKQALLAIMGVLLTAALSIGGTLAYLTDRDSVANTFTVGDVQIELDETKTDARGNPVDKDGNSILPGSETEPVKTKEGNEYHLIPGQTYLKDPTVTVNAHSEESYVRMIMVVHNASAVQAIVEKQKHKLEDFSSLLEGWNQEVWVYDGFTEDQEKNTISFEFRYQKKIDKTTAEATVLPSLFTAIKVPGTVTNAELKKLYGDENDSSDDFKMEIFGHAIQAATFADADAAWAAFDVQNEPAKP